MTTEPLAYLNGALVPQSRAALPVNDAGLVLGATVTDLCRTFHHRLYRWEDHLARFRRSCRAARIYPPVSEDEINAAAARLVEYNAALLTPQQDLALVLVATPGPLGHYLGHTSDSPPTFLMHTFPLPFHRYRRLFEQGARLVIPATRHVPPQCLDPRIKQRSRLHWWIAEQEARQLDPGATALLLDLDGRVTETAAANLLLVSGETVLTPPRHTVLDGVSLGVVEGLCADLGIPFREAPLAPYDCLSADEALLSCTSYCLAPVASIQGTPLRCPGPVFEALLGRWSEAVGMDIRGQILGGPPL